MDSSRCNDGTLRSLVWFDVHIFQFDNHFNFIKLISEHIFSNLLPTTLSIIALNAPLSTSWVWLTMSTIDTLGIHSGYHLPFLHSPHFHNYHHEKFNECFGWLGLLDSFHDTSAKFQESIHGLRHKTLINFTSIDGEQLECNKTE